MPVSTGTMEITDDGRATLLGGRCRACAAPHFPLAATCPYCGAGSVERMELPHRGTLWGWTAVTTAPPGYEGPVPYGFGVVELGGELRIITRITEVDPSALSFGQPVELVVDTVGATGDGDDLVAWAFSPASSAVGRSAGTQPGSAGERA